MTRVIAWDRLLIIVVAQSGLASLTIGPEHLQVRCHIHIGCRGGTVHYPNLAFGDCGETKAARSRALSVAPVGLRQMPVSHLFVNGQPPSLPNVVNTFLSCRLPAYHRQMLVGLASADAAILTVKRTLTLIASPLARKRDVYRLIVVVI